VKAEIMIGGALLLAGVGGAAWYLGRRSQPSSSVTVVPGSKVAVLPAPSTAPTVSAVVPVAPANPTATVTNADLAAQLAAERSAQEARAAREAAEAAERKKQDQIRTLQNALGNIENQQLLVLSRIRAVNSDRSRLSDFERKYVDDVQASSRWLQMVKTCKETVSKNCGFDMFGACNGANQPVCDKKEPDYAWGNPAAALWNEARATGAPAMLAQWQAEQRAPLEADLYRLEVQYRGALAELNGLGGSYSVQSNEAHVYAANLKG
jgi:hypothetical protein